MLQKAFAEGLRAMVLWTAHVQDQVAIAGGHGHDEARAARRAQRPDAAADQGLRLGEGLRAARGLAAVLRRLGLLQDYPIEQYIRDQKIDSLYEGTTHIQALDLFFRKIGRDRGATLQALLGQIGKTAEGLPAELGVEKAALAGGARRRAGHRRRRCSASSGSPSTTSASRATASCSRSPSS